MPYSSRQLIDNITELFEHPTAPVASLISQCGYKGISIPAMQGFLYCWCVMGGQPVREWIDRAGASVEWRDHNLQMLATMIQCGLVRNDLPFTYGTPIPLVQRLPPMEPEEPARRGRPRKQHDAAREAVAECARTIDEALEYAQPLVETVRPFEVPEPTIAKATKEATPTQEVKTPRSDPMSEYNVWRRRMHETLRDVPDSDEALRQSMLEAEEAAINFDLAQSQLRTRVLKLYMHISAWRSYNQSTTLVKCFVVTGGGVNLAQWLPCTADLLGKAYITWGCTLEGSIRSIGDQYRATVRVAQTNENHTSESLVEGRTLDAAKQWVEQQLIRHGCTLVQPERNRLDVRVQEKSDDDQAK